MRIFFEEKPRHYIGDFPALTIHYRAGEKQDAELLASKIRDVLDDEDQCKFRLNVLRAKIGNE